MKTKKQGKKGAAPAVPAVKSESPAGKANPPKLPLGPVGASGASVKAQPEPKATAKKNVPVVDKDRAGILKYDEILTELFTVEVGKVQKLLDEWDVKLDKLTKDEALKHAAKIKAIVKGIYDRL